MNTLTIATILHVEFVSLHLDRKWKGQFHTYNTPIILPAEVIISFWLLAIVEPKQWRFSPVTTGLKRHACMHTNCTLRSKSDHLNCTVAVISFKSCLLDSFFVFWFMWNCGLWQAAQMTPRAKICLTFFGCLTSIMMDTSVQWSWDDCYEHLDITQARTSWR